MRRLVIIPALFVVLACGPASAARADDRQPDPDQSAKVSTDLNLSLLTLTSGVYQLTIQNQSGLGTINTFAWVPGPGWRVTAILGASPGTCVVNAGAISCSGKIPPPKTCTCLPGGRMTIRFRMTHSRFRLTSKTPGTAQVGTAGGYIVVKTVTMVHRHIPTMLPPANE
jgi:hypothetical protein